MKSCADCGDSHEKMGRFCQKCAYARLKQKVRFRMYKCWAGAKDRCTNPKHPSFANYGAKGIQFALDLEEFRDRFVADFALFLSRGVSPTIDRLDPSKGYTIDNIRIVPAAINSAEGNATMIKNWKEKRPVERLCPDCQKLLPLTVDYFHVKYKRKTDGSPVFGPRCKDCHRAYANHRAKIRGFWDRRQKTKP